MGAVGSGGSVTLVVGVATAPAAALDMTASAFAFSIRCTISRRTWEQRTIVAVAPVRLAKYLTLSRLSRSLA